MPDLFADSKRSLRRANYHFGSFGECHNEIIRDNPWTHVVEKTDGGEQIHKIRFHKRFTDDIPSMIFDYVSNLRAALDQATYAAFVAVKKPDTEFGYFPFASDAAHWPNRIKGLKGLPDELLSLLASFSAYKGGNDSLWALNTLCNVQKHATLIPITPGSATISLPGVNLGNFKSVQFHPFDPDTNEIVVITFGPGWNAPTDGALIQFAIALYHPDPVINGQHPLFLLDGMRREVARVVEAIEAECKELGLL